MYPLRKKPKTNLKPKKDWGAVGYSGGHAIPCRQEHSLWLFFIPPSNPTHLKAKFLEISQTLFFTEWCYKLLRNVRKLMEAVNCA